MSAFDPGEEFLPGAPPDFAQALKQMGHDEEGLAELCRIFLEETPKMRDALLAARPRPGAALADCLHEVANSLQIIGAELSSRSLRDVESRLRVGSNAPAAESVVRHAVHLLLQAAVAVNAYLRQHPDGDASGAPKPS